MNWYARLMSKVSLFIRIPMAVSLVILLLPTLFGLLPALIGAWTFVAGPFIVSFTLYLIYQTLKEWVDENFV